MVIRKKEDDERSVQRMGQVLCRVREDAETNQGVQQVPASAQEGRAASGYAEDAAYNRNEEGVSLVFHGKFSGKRKLRDEDVVRLRRNEEQLSINQWAQLFGTVNSVIWKAIKGYSYKHLNWRYPPLR